MSAVRACKRQGRALPLGQNPDIGAQRLIAPKLLTGGGGMKRGHSQLLTANRTSKMRRTEVIR